MITDDESHEHPHQIDDDEEHRQYMIAFLLRSVKLLYKHWDGSEKGLCDA